MYMPLLFNGGVYRYNEIEDLIEDLGGFVIQKNIAQTEVTIFFLIPEEDVERVREKALELKGEIKEAPLTGMEVAVVVPTISIHHLPHPACDVAEYLRRKGAKSNIIGLSRGVGKRIAMLTLFEKNLINEHDIAIFIFGNLRECIIKKFSLLTDISIPSVVTGYPSLTPPPGVEYVAGMGRMVGKFSRESDIQLLEEIAEKVKKLAEIRKELIGDLEFPPFYIKTEIERQIPDVVEELSPAPITVKIDGLRVKLSYEKYSEKLEKVKLIDTYLGDIAEITPSVVKGHTLIKLIH
ncbi:MAG: methanogenesis marker 7 protein [Candidatus Korarchaeum sp.]|nr:methanogenesis marker 7 protein [Candidatus Korarchaeum sp.]